MSDIGTAGAKPALGIGEIIGQSFSLTLGNLLKLFLIMLVPLLVMAAVGYLMFGDMINLMLAGLTGGDTSGMEEQLAAQMGDMMIPYLVFMVVSVFAQAFLYASVIKAMFDARTTGTMSVGAALSAGIARTVQVFVALLVLGIVVGIVFLIIGFVLGMLAQALGPDIGGLLTAIIMLVLVLYMYGIFAPYVPIAVVENNWVPIGRSFQLTKGYRWWIVLLIFLLGLCLMVVYLIFGVIGYVLLMLGEIGVWIMFVLGLFMAVLIAGIPTAAITILYAKLRDIKEGVSGAELASVFD